MTHETDLPCSDCGTALVDRTLDIRDIAVSAPADGQITVADCPACGARHYPRESIVRLFDPSNDARPHGGS